VRLGLKGNNEHLKPGFVVLQSGGCSNRSQVIRLSVWEETVFQEWIPTCEDKLWEKEATASGWKFAVLPEVASYHNPYMNTAKESQEFYTMARYIESRRCSLSHAVQLLGAAGRELIRGNREKTKHYLELFRSKVQGSLGLARHFHSDSYRRKPS
ncbi:MAG: hypothetical protein Q7Q71_03630, partial [Verrucomicrobiota bacterium JB023]|nr:hypothetical protein [Verrucomicrobiota bacterium JB023]